MAQMRWNPWMQDYVPEEDDQIEQQGEPGEELVRCSSCRRRYWSEVGPDRFYPTVESHRVEFDDELFTSDYLPYSYLIGLPENTMVDDFTMYDAPELHGSARRRALLQEARDNAPPPPPPPDPYNPVFYVGFDGFQFDPSWQPPPPYVSPPVRLSASPNGQPLMIRDPSGMLVVPDAAAASPPAPPARPRRAIRRRLRAPVQRVANLAPKAAPIRAQVAAFNRRRPVVPVMAPNQRAAPNYAVARGEPIGFDVRDLDRINRRGRPVPIPDRPRWRY